MTATIIKHFDTLNYVEQSTALGVDENIAKYQARQIEQAIDIAVNTASTEIDNKELATKQDIKKLDIQIQATKHDIKRLETQFTAKLETEIHKAKFDIVVWVIGLLIVNGIFEHFFK